MIIPIPPPDWRRRGVLIPPVPGNNGKILSQVNNIL
jgi:hypothetical protein